MITFRQLRQTMNLPSWMTDGESGLVGYALDAVKDAFVERARNGLLIRFPQQGPDGTPAPDDALAASGRDRRIVRGINEAGATYAARLVRWLDDWRTAGNPFAMMQQLAAYTGPGPAFRTVDVRGTGIRARSTERSRSRSTRRTGTGIPIPTRSRSGRGFGS